MNRIWRALGVTVASLGLLVGAAFPAAAAELMTVTFIRHGESAGNAAGLIDTSTPGPSLTAKGQQQAQAIADKLGYHNYDAIYASTMVRTQQTAAPMSNYLNLPVVVLPGLQEVEAGVFEGTPESQAANGYAKFPLAWALAGQRNLRIPGSIDGNEFDARIDGALKTMYDNGDRNPVVFSHGAAIMFWTMMNAQNLTLEQKINLLKTAPLDNTNYVVVEGNPEDGWTLVNWNGQQFSPDRTLGAEVGLQLRTLVRQLSTSVQQVTAAFATGNPGAVLSAVAKGAADAAYSVVKFGNAVQAKVTTEVASDLAKGAAPAPAPAVAAVAAPATPEPAAAPKAKSSVVAKVEKEDAVEAKVAEPGSNKPVSTYGTKDASEPSTETKSTESKSTETASTASATKDTGTKESPAAAAKESASKDNASKDNESKDTGSSDSASKDSASKSAA